MLDAIEVAEVGKMWKSLHPFDQLVEEQTAGRVLSGFQVRPTVTCNGYARQLRAPVISGRFLSDSYARRSYLTVVSDGHI